MCGSIFLNIRFFFRMACSAFDRKPRSNWWFLYLQCETCPPLVSLLWNLLLNVAGTMEWHSGELQLWLFVMHLPLCWTCYDQLPFAGCCNTLVDYIEARTYQQLFIRYCFPHIVQSNHYCASDILKFVLILSGEWMWRYYKSDKTQLCRSNSQRRCVNKMTASTKSWQHPSTLHTDYGSRMPTEFSLWVSLYFPCTLPLNLNISICSPFGCACRCTLSPLLMFC